MSTADMRPQLAEDVVDLMARVSFCVAAERDRGFQQRRVDTLCHAQVRSAVAEHSRLQWQGQA
jgi:hypothetical protein